MVAIHSSSKSKSKSKHRRIRIFFIMMLMILFVALLAGFVLQNLHMSIVKQHENNPNRSHESHLGLRIPSDHAPRQEQERQEEEKQQHQQQQQQDAEPDADDDQNDTEEQANFVEEEPDNNALDDDDGAEDEQEGDEDKEEEEGGNDTEQEQPQGRGDDGVNGGDDEEEEAGQQQEDKDNNNNIAGMRQEEEEQGAADAICPYGALSALTKTERYPHANDNDNNKRHMVDPPQGGKVALVCCMTTAGPWNFVIRHAWAPNGAQRVQSMVESGYFGNQKVTLMRCIHNFLCQFGLAGDASKEFDGKLLDDPNWLPEGAAFRENATTGVKRFATGYLAYAGAGPNSRGVQLIVALAPNGPLGGGSPWEVPWGETVGVHSFETLSQIYTGYAEKGPSQGLLRREGASENVAKQFPKLDYITSCQIVDEEEQTPGDEEVETAEEE